VNESAPIQEPASGTAAEAAAAFEEGMRRFLDRDLPGAHAAFERAHRKAGREPRSMSWYGVTLVLVERNSSLGVLYCDQAVRAAGPEPELLLNQARVHLALGQRERAVRAVARGLERDPGHAGLNAAREALGWRRRPVLPFLVRTHPLNRWLGSLRHRWTHRSAGERELSPLTLGLPAGGASPEA
jgi:tetratricopeptide (TPR) repeat protein